MIKIPPEKISQMESMYPGITEQIEYFEKKTLPACPDCGSEDTAIVNVGTIGRTICITGATTKFHLRANDRQGDYYCNACQQYFSRYNQKRIPPDVYDPVLKYGQLYYDTGERKYEGYYRQTGSKSHRPEGPGVTYYKDGAIWEEGIFGEFGLRDGKEYYRSGQLRFEGTYGIIDYVHLFPAYGRYFLEDGTLAFSGEFRIEKDHQGYWRIVKPENFGPVSLGKRPAKAPEIQYGKLYYDSGELRYEGHYETAEHDVNVHYARGSGSLYYRDGTLHKEGTFGLGGLLEGRIYYPSGQLKFEGKFNDKSGKGGSYYGPTYPIKGKFWLEDGSLAYEGKFEVVRQGNVGFPKVVFPENFGSLD